MHDVLTRNDDRLMPIAFDGERHNNKMERMNGELRQREKVFRTLEKPDTAILNGMGVDVCSCCKSASLDSKTPGHKAGIEVKGTNKWLTLIQNASRLKDALYG